MSNSYTHVAFDFDAATSENATTICEWIQSRSDLYFEAQPAGSVLTITSEAADVGELVELLHRAMQTMPNIPSPQGFEWAFSADKHRVGEFGGGAVVLHREPAKINSIDTAEWLKKELDLLTSRPFAQGNASNARRAPPRTNAGLSEE